jgi:hypothetical protein
MTVSSREPDDSPWEAAWAQALGALESDVAASEQLLRALHSEAAMPLADGSLGSWVPPVDLGPLPETMEERARTVRARQLEVATALAVAAQHSRRQLAFAGRVETGTGRPARPLYVDAAF